MEQNTKEQLTLSLGDSHVSPSALPVNVRAKKMIDTSGRKCLELLKKLNLPGLLARTLLASSEWYSNKYYLTWKTRVITPKHLSFQLALSGRCTNETDFGLWLTPTASDGKMSKKKTDSCYVTKSGTVRLINKKGLSSNAGLSNMVQFYPTPTAQDAKNLTLPPSQKDRDSIPGMLLKEGITGKLNPEWVEWLMGYPIGWTELKD